MAAVIFSPFLFLVLLFVVVVVFSCFYGFFICTDVGLGLSCWIFAFAFSLSSGGNIIE